MSKQTIFDYRTIMDLLEGRVVIAYDEREGTYPICLVYPI